jgi:hypothetical protein
MCIVEGRIATTLSKIKIMKTHLEPYNLHTRLHMEVLQEKYGKIDVQVLCDDDHKREVLLIDKDFVARTYALTLKKNDWKQNKEICAVNEAIKNGEGIGGAFKEWGFDIQKNVLDVYIIKLPKWLQEAFGTENKAAKARITEFMVKKDKAIYNYGIVTEIYSPDFRKPKVNDADKTQINIPLSVLQSLGFSEEEIWRSLEKKIITPYLAKLYSFVVKEMKEEFSASSIRSFHTD